MPRVLKAVGLQLTEDAVRIMDVMPTQMHRKPPIQLAMEPAEEDGPVVIRDVTTLAPRELEAQDEIFEEEGFDSPGSAHLLQKAHEEAQTLLENAIQEAEQERAGIIARAEQEAEEMRRRAQAEGRQEGFAAVAQDMQTVTAQLEDTVARLEGEQAGFEAEYEDQLQWAALEIAGKVLNQKVAQDDAVMTDMVAKAVANLKNESWIRVEVAQDMTRLIGKLTDLFEPAEHIDISPIPAEDGTILIETPSGVTDASLKTQLENLKTYFQNAGV